VNEATYTWEGQLPPRHYKNPVYSCKVFLGGVPWDITEGELTNTHLRWRLLFGMIRGDEEERRWIHFNPFY